MRYRGVPASQSVLPSGTSLDRTEPAALVRRKCVSNPSSLWRCCPSWRQRMRLPRNGHCRFRRGIFCDVLPARSFCAVCRDRQGEMVQVGASAHLVLKFGWNPLCLAGKAIMFSPSSASVIRPSAHRLITGMPFAAERNGSCRRRRRCTTGRVVPPCQSHQS